MTGGAARRVALVPSEPLRPRMAGIGIRYLELARRLPQHGLAVRLVTAGDPAEVPGDELDAEVVAFRRGELRRLLAGCDVVVTQGQLANDVVLELETTPVVVDLYDPFLVENLHYVESLGLDPYRNDHATWVLQLARGDFFLCSCEEQRDFYLGFLTALGRVHPRLVARDPDLRGLIDVVPFGVPAQLAAHRPLLPPREEGEKRVFFGGLYEWYDPWPVLSALERLDRPGWTLYLVRNPNPGSTPQRLLAEVEAWCRRRGWGEERLRILDWVPADRRYDLLRDVDVVVATHRRSLETRLSLRTRFLDALAAGCAVVTSEGGAMSRLLAAHGAGWVVPEGSPEAVAEALVAALEGPEELHARRRRGSAELLAAFRWQAALEPLLAFCREPRRDATKDDFAFRPPTRAPRDPLTFRLRRWLRRLATGSPAGGGAS